MIITIFAQHDRLNLEQRAENGGQLDVKTSDIARLMELFQVKVTFTFK